MTAYQWDAWRETALAARRMARVWSVGAGLVVAAAAVWIGSQLLPGAARFSAALYVPVVAWPVVSLVRSFILKRRLGRVVDQVRPMLIPALVQRLDDDTVLKILLSGGALLTRLSMTIVTERRDAAIAIIASEYDLQFSDSWDFGSAGGG
ncbi:MAG: hypothetical protein JWP31_1374 [Aeromicrobium sp.]|nr:hypothetical protein [Aeromicrobium sp.]